MDQPSIGESLRRAREGLSASIYEAARDTKIRVDYLEAMERDSFRFVSGGTYVRSMLRTYAGWLGLDAEKIAETYDHLYGSAGPSLAEIFKPPAQPPPRSRQRLWGVAAVIAASLLLLLSLVGIINPPRTRVASPPVPESDEPSTPSPAATQELVQAPPVAQGVKLVLRVTGERCWIRVLADSDKPLFEGTLTNGDERTFEASQVLKVTFGKLTAVHLTVNGTDLGTPSGEGETGTFIFYPDTKSLQRG